MPQQVARLGGVLPQHRSTPLAHYRHRTGTRLRRILPAFACMVKGKGGEAPCNTKTRSTNTCTRASACVRSRSATHEENNVKGTNFLILTLLLLQAFPESCARLWRGSVPLLSAFVQWLSGSVPLLSRGGSRCASAGPYICPPCVHLSNILYQGFIRCCKPGPEMCHTCSHLGCGTRPFSNDQDGEERVVRPWWRVEHVAILPLYT